MLSADCKIPIFELKVPLPLNHPHISAYPPLNTSLTPSTTCPSHQHVLLLHHFSCHPSIRLSSSIHQCIYSSIHALSTSALPRPLFHPSLPISLSLFTPFIHLCYLPSVPHFTHPFFPLVTFFPAPIEVIYVQRQYDSQPTQPPTPR